MSIGQRQTLVLTRVEDPSENKICSLDSRSTTRINVHEWASESIANPTLSNQVNNIYRVGSLQLYGRVRLGFTQICGSFQSAFSTEEEIRAHSSGEATMSFCKAMKQPLADLQLLQPETKETASEPILWHTSEDLNHVRGRCTTGTDDKTHKKQAFIFQSETMRRNYFKFRLGCSIISLHFTHSKVCIMQWQCSGLLFSCTDSIPGDCSHIFGEAVALVCGKGQLILSAVSNAIAHSWLRSTASGSCLLNYTSVTLLKYLIIDPTYCVINFSYDRLLAIGEFTFTNVTC